MGKYYVKDDRVEDMLGVIDEYRPQDSQRDSYFPNGWELVVVNSEWWMVETNGTREDIEEAVVLPASSKPEREPVKNDEYNPAYD